MQSYSDTHTLELITKHAVPVSDGTIPRSVLKDLIGPADVVLLGEATHGTHEFYLIRCEITKRLITDFGFNAVAIEGDWPDAYRVNRYVREEGGDLDAADALRGFERFPTWMWRNVVVADFIGWLRDHNDRIAERRIRTGFYGLDLYSLYPSAMEVVRYLDRTDPELAAEARERYSCLNVFGDRPEFTPGTFIPPSCEQEVLDLLVELMNHRNELLDRDGFIAEEEQFAAERNASAVHNAVRYYRGMLNARANTWNLRDTHMMETLKGLCDHLGRGGNRGRVVVWAHNSHLGDARATAMSRRGELNLGQLARQEFGDRVRSIGMTTYEGTVTAAHDWDMPPTRMRLRPGREESYENLFHRVGLPGFVVPMEGELAERLAEERLERAVGVIYRPSTELQSHYFGARIAEQFDALIHIDHTRALEPLARVEEKVLEEPPETFPTAM